MFKNIPCNCDFSTKFSTYIIAYCLDTNSWFCTNERFFIMNIQMNFNVKMML